MERNKFIPCDDRIEVDKAYSEMTLENLVVLKNLVEMCQDCPGCDGMLEDILKELEIRKGKN